MNPKRIRKPIRYYWLAADPKNLSHSLTACGRSLPWTRTVITVTQTTCKTCRQVIRHTRRQVVA